MTRALVVRLDALGDVLLSGPAVRAVRAGADHVAYLCGPRGAAATALLPGVDACIVHAAPWIEPDGGAPVDAGRTAALVSEVRAAAIDVAVILGSFHQSPLPAALLLRLAGVGRIVAISEDFPGALLDGRVPDPGDVHEVERALLVAAGAGFALPQDDDGALRVDVPPGAGPRLLPGTVVVHPGASVAARAWPAERHRDLVAALVARHVPVVVTGGPEERALTRRVAAPAGPGADLGGELDLPALAAPPAADVHAELVDLRAPREAEAAVRRAADALGGLDAVVTAAGTDACGTLEEVDAVAWDDVVRVNLLGTAAVVRGALPSLLERHGHVVTVASTLGLRALPAATAYCASKFGVVGFTRALAAELAGRVRVTLVIPGGMETAFFEGREERFRPPPDAVLNPPARVAEVILAALRTTPPSELREVVVAPSAEPSWP